MDDGQRHRGVPWWFWGALGISLLAAWTYIAEELGKGFAIPTMIVGAVSVAVVSLGPVGRAMARRIEGRRAEVQDDLVTAELEEVRGRMVELEERLDFAERMLAQGERHPEQMR